MFEAAICKTVLIMYPGDFKEIFVPDRHFIELKRDHSNIESVVERIRDDEYLQEMADRTYSEVVESGR